MSEQANMDLTKMIFGGPEGDMEFMPIVPLGEVEMNEDERKKLASEIPVLALQRAKHFYQVAFGIHMEDMSMPGMEMAGFPYEPGNGKASGGLVKSESHKPSKEGVVIYLNANPDMSDVLGRIRSEGGVVDRDKTWIGQEIG